MAGKCFFDTTVLIYAVTEGDPRNAIAEELLAEGGAISVQVLNEFVSVARRKLKFTWEQTETALQALRTLCDKPAPVTVEVHEAALKIAKRYGFSVYDAMILAAAIELKCSTLYSEDMQHGQNIGPLKIRNPFRKA